MGKNKKNKLVQKSKVAQKNSHIASHSKSTDKKNKTLNKKTVAKKPPLSTSKTKHSIPPKKLVPVKPSEKSKFYPRSKDKNLKKEQPQLKSNVVTAKKEATDKNLKVKASAKEKKGHNQSLSSKKETLEKLAPPLAKTNGEKRNKAEVETGNKNVKNAKKKVESEEKPLAKSVKTSKSSEKEKGDPDFDEAFDDFELGGGDDVIDDTDFDAELLLEEENKKNNKKKKIVDDEIREQLADEIINLSEEYGLADVLGAIRSLDFFSSDNIDCREKACDNPATSQGYCRFHYIKRWKDIKKKNLILTEGRLQKMIEELISKNPFKYVEAILNDLMDEKTFGTVLRELNIDMTSDEGFDDVGDDEMDEEDIAFETKVTVKVAFDED